VDIDHVVSPKGAIGKYQVTPDTARGLGIDPATLTDPAVNKKAAGLLLDQLSRRYGNDPEAIAIAYNAGPKRADHWLASGRDDAVLLKETADYVGRLRTQEGFEPHAANRANYTPVESHIDAGRAAIVQSEADLVPDVRNAVDEANDRSYRRSALTLADEHEQSLADIEYLGRRDFLEARTTNKGIFDRPDTNAMQQQVEFEGTQRPAATEDTGPLVAEENRHAEVVKNVQAQAEAMGDETFKTDMAKHDEADAEADEFTKGVQAAVRCAITRGLG
jgi:hypothetical protein